LLQRSEKGGEQWAAGRRHQAIVILDLEAKRRASGIQFSTETTP